LAGDFIAVLPANVAGLPPHVNVARHLKRLTGR
jgi:hypothetical protein